jgi:hypothetical protein
LDLYFKENNKEENLSTLNDKNFIRVEYMFENKIKTYIPDFFIKDKNCIIEVKSEYTFNKEYNKNIQKFNSCINNGYNFKCYIFDNKGKIINLIEGLKNEKNFK